MHLLKLSVTILTVILISLPFNISAQEKSESESEPKKQASGNTSIDGLFGVHYLRKDTLDSYMSAAGNTRFKNAAQIVGISFTKSFNTGDDKSQDAYFTFQYQIPEIINGTDSVNYRFTGYQFGFCFGGKDVFHSNPKLDLVYALGVQFGGYYITREYRYTPFTVARIKNGVIAPQILVEGRYFAGPLKLGMKMSVQYDISNTSWKQLDISPTVFGGFSATGVAFQAVLGYKL